MKKESSRRLGTQFDPEVEFEVNPAFVRLETRRVFGDLQGRLVEQRFHEPANSLLRQDVEMVAQDAAALAWATPYPLLVFPVLFEERIDVRLVQAGRQERIQEQSRSIMIEALAETAV